MTTELKRAAGVMKQIADGWTNVLSGLGGRRDKGNVGYTRFCPGPQLDRATLAEAYRSNWLIRRIVNAVPEEATRRGFGEGFDAPRFDELNHARYADGALVRAANLARLMGGAGVYIGYANGGSDLTQPAAENAEVAFLEVFHRWELQGVERSRVTDPSDPRYGQPDLWQVIGQNRTGLVFHHTRFVKFPGQPRADNFETISATDRDWEDSVLQSVWEDAVRYGMFWQGVSHLLQISSVGVLKLDGLIQLLASQNAEDAEARIDLLNQQLSMTRLVMLDARANEEYHRESVSFADVPALLQELQTATAGAVKMPVAALFGRSPAGMNATGESDMRMWYDSVDVWRELVLKPRAERLIGTCERKDVTIEWPPLWEPTEKECAEVRQIKVNTNERLWSMGVASDAEIRRALFENKPVEELLSGPPTAEPTRAVTQIQVVEPGENAAAPIDPTAEDEPAPVKAPSPFPPKA